VGGSLPWKLLNEWNMLSTGRLARIQLFKKIDSPPFKKGRPGGISGKAFFNPLYLQYGHIPPDGEHPGGKPWSYPTLFLYPPKVSATFRI